jgi:tetratricopeptide (TPR) repeat protein
MSAGRNGAIGLGLPLVFGLLAAAAPSFGAPSVADALSLYKHKRFSEARAMLEPLAASQPSNAETSYYLGMAILREGGPSSLDLARSWLGKAAKLAPDNEDYLSQYAGVCLLVADRDNSFSLALEGRDAMTRAIAENPRDLEACEGLMRFYAKAPWPLGSPEKALSLAAEIARADPGRGASAYRSLADTFKRGGLDVQARSAAERAQSLAPGRPQ